MNQNVGQGFDLVTDETILGLLKTEPEVSLTTIVKKLGKIPTRVPDVDQVHKKLTIMCSSGTLLHTKEGDFNMYRLNPDPPPPAES